MQGIIIRNICLWCGMLLMAACHTDDLGSEVSPQGAASLRVVVKGQSLAHPTVRGVEDLDDNGIVSEEERILDGQRMYRLLVCMVAGGQVVASVTLEENDSRFLNGNTEAAVTFENLDYSKTYELYAVANLGNYGTLTSGLSALSASNILSAPQLNASSDHICNVNTVYPLSLKQQVRLNPGENTVSGALKRTYARLRINVRNQSAESDLTVTALSFPTHFTRNSVNLFTEGGTADATPVATAAGAITPFVPNMQIPKITEAGTVSEMPIFDSYLLESDGGTYNYSLGLKYTGGEVEKYVVENKAITKLADIKDGEMYVMFNSNSGRYLYANGNSVGAGSSFLTNNELNHNYVWKFTKTNAYYNYYRIESMGATGYFMQSSDVSSSRVPLVVNPGSSDYFTASESGNNLRFRSTKSQYFLSVNGSSVVGHNSSSNQNRRNFTLYRVVKQTEAGSVSRTVTVPINIVNPTTGIASSLTTIRRNDFIEMRLNVSYNTDKGSIDFEVADWDRVNGDVTFD